MMFRRGSLWAVLTLCSLAASLAAGLTPTAATSELGSIAPLEQDKGIFNRAQYDHLIFKSDLLAYTSDAFIAGSLAVTFTNAFSGRGQVIPEATSWALLGAGIITIVPSFMDRAEANKLKNAAGAQAALVLTPDARGLMANYSAHF
jgi:hypothetical protein